MTRKVWTLKELVFKYLNENPPSDNNKGYNACRLKFGEHRHRVIKTYVCEWNRYIKPFRDFYELVVKKGMWKKPLNRKELAMIKRIEKKIGI